MQHTLAAEGAQADRGALFAGASHGEQLSRAKRDAAN